MSDNAIHLGGDFHSSILPLAGSDHWPILLQWSQPGSHCNRTFRFESFWFSHAGFKDFVTNAWRSFVPADGSKMFQFQQKLRNLKHTLKQWNKSQFGNIFDNQKELELKMSLLQQKIIIEGRTEDYDKQETTLLTKIYKSRQQEETLWRQKS